MVLRMDGVLESVCLPIFQEGQRLVFREGRTKAVGNVTLVIPHNPVGAAKGGQGGTSVADRGGEKAMAKAARNEQRHNKTAPTSAGTANADQPAQQAVAS